MTDIRHTQYGEVLAEQLAREREQNRYSASKILSLLWQHYKPHSVIDIGCGIGTWLNVCQSMGVTSIKGIDGPWTQDALLEIASEHIVRVDFEKQIASQGEYDLAICLEVAEHLTESAASHFVDFVAQSAPVVLFSAAIPFQGGTHHLNEQWPHYWADLFAKRSMIPLDFIRRAIWGDVGIHWWLRQNAMCFVRRSLLDELSHLRAHETSPSSLPVVHPSLYLSKINTLTALQTRMQAIIELLSKGGVFEVHVKPNGELQIQKR